MSLTYSPETDISITIPSFKLPDVNGNIFDSKTFEHSKVKVVFFICNHCPYVKAIEDRIIQLASSFASQPVHFVGICSNDAKDYPEDRPEELARRSQEKSYPFAYLVDESQEVARSFGAVCTPDFFVFDSNGHLFYRGRLDDSWKDPSKVTREELKEAIQMGLEVKPLDFKPIPSMGCSIKWKEKLLQ